MHSNKPQDLFDHSSISHLVTNDLRKFKDKANAYFEDDTSNGLEVIQRTAIPKSEWLEFGRQGFLGLGVPAELGGQGFGQLGAFALSSALSKTLDVGLSLGFHVHNDVAMGWLVATQQHKIRDTYLPEMLKGRLIGCTCFTEHGAAEMTQARLEGDQIILNGHKAFAINGLHADLCFLTASLDGRLCTVLVEKDRPGVSIGKTQDKLGATSIDQADIIFSDVAVSVDNIVSKPGLQQLMHWNNVMTTARAHVAFDAYLLMKILFEYMVSYSRSRIVGERPLGSWPIHQQELANAYMHLELVRSNLANFIELKTENERANLVEHMAELKHFAIERAYEFALKCCDMEGGRGFMNDSVSLHIVKQLMALRYSTGSQYKTKEIASAFHREKHKRQSTDLLSQSAGSPA